MAEIKEFKLMLVPKTEKITVPVDNVLDAAKGELTDCLVIGYDNNEDLYVACTHGDKAQILLMINTFKHKLLNGDYD
jgi:hypothetical protein